MLVMPIARPPDSAADEEEAYNREGRQFSVRRWVLDRTHPEQADVLSASQRQYLYLSVFTVLSSGSGSWCAAKEENGPKEDRNTFSLSSEYLFAT